MTGTRPMAMQFARIGDLVNQDKRAGEEGSFLYRHGSARPYGIHTSLHLSGKSTPWQAPRTLPTRHGPAGGLPRPSRINCLGLSLGNEAARKHGAPCVRRSRGEDGYMAVIAASSMAT